MLNNKKVLIKSAALLVLVCLALALSYAFKKYDATGGYPTAGKDKYIAHCLSCHGDKGLGDGVIAKSLPSQPSNLSKELNAFFNYDSVLINRIVLKGKIEDGMPAFDKILTKEEVKDIFAYIRLINN